MTSTPCQTGNPDDWFIEKNGQQYKDEPLELTEAEEQVVLAASDGKPWGEVEEALGDALAEKVRQAQIRRRKARDACHTACPVRAACLDQRLTQRMEYGIWGGYYPEELAELERAIDRRADADSRR